MVLTSGTRRYIPSSEKESSGSAPILKPFSPTPALNGMQGKVSLFGFPDTFATVEVLPRSLGWRALRASAFVGGGLVLAPAVGLIPPHAPWAVAALGIGAFMGLRKWRERFTILSFHGTCPRCGGALFLPPHIPLRPVMTVPCEACNHDSRFQPSAPADSLGEEEAS
jgi:hypothetical protein